MIKENKLKYIISLIIIVLPTVISMFIKSSLEDMMKAAWNFTWLMPLVLAVLHTFLLWLTRHIDPVKQSKKIENITFFIIPAISLYVGVIFIAIMLGLDINIGLVCSIILGVSFIIMGNYMPKAKRNRTFGIKLKWTVTNDDNWVATHRLAGKVFVVAGILCLILAFLPFKAMIISFVAILTAIVIIPTVYSYVFYKKQIAGGAATEEDYKDDKPMTKKGVAAVVISIVAISLLVCILMTTGGMNFTFTDDALEIKPSFGGGLTLEYAELDDAEIEYRDSKVPGMRVMGYASMKLLYGQFSNDEFGTYTRYTYTGSDSAVVIHTEGGVIVISAETSEDTLALYNTLVSKIVTKD